MGRGGDEQQAEGRPEWHPADEEKVDAPPASNRGPSEKGYGVGCQWGFGGRVGFHGMSKPPWGVRRAGAPAMDENPWDPINMGHTQTRAAPGADASGSGQGPCSGAADAPD